MVTVVRAEGLKHMNNFSGDHPYVVCEVKHEDRHAKKTSSQTKPVTAGDTLNPVWNEALMLDPWTPGESLEFTIYDKGLLGSKTEGKAFLPSDMFYPQGFFGTLQVSGKAAATGALLQVEIQAMGGGSAMQEVAYPAGVAHEQQAPQAYTTSQVTPATYEAAPATSTAYQAPQAYTTSQVTPATYEAAPAISTAYQAAPATSITYAAPTSPLTTQSPVTYTSGAGSTQAPMTYSAAQPSQPYVVQGVQPGLAGVTMSPTSVAGPQRLAVSILQAHGLQHMNHFTGDHPYVTCQVKHLGHHDRTTRVETKTVTEGDVQNPFWGETHHLDPWHMGEALEFTVYDKGLIGSKTEGKVILPSEYFHSQGFSGMLQISGLPQALLHVIVRPIGPSTVETAGSMTMTEAIESGTTKLKKLKKKLMLLSQLKK
jgi:hypothetical protein